MLTQKQLDLLQFIHTRLQREGVPPSFDEMKEALDLRSKSGIHRLITALEERGFIRRLAHKARAIEIVKLPENLENKSFRPKVIDGDRPDGPRPRGSVSVESSAGNLVPLLGKVAAGGPIHAISEAKAEITVPPNLLAGKGPHYALEVDGDSMIEAGINPGDVVVIREGTTAQNGDIVVAAFQDHDEYVVTLKKFYLRDGRVALKAANPRYEDRILPRDQVEVQGRLVGLIRSY
ncbi:transcriptional repressor LexA [Fluviibacterium sp. DFM31]|uniref:LexA repressor n=1 Tax=Meridianimarinicoccus marinus TaxID=3231483 RepID=A0ABV3L3Z1_9RHOB